MSPLYITQTYRLPDGQIVNLDATAVKSEAVTGYTLADGTLVTATRIDPDPQPGDIVSVEDGRFTGCILTLLERRGGWFLCRNDSYGEHYGLKDGENVYAIRTRAVALYLTQAEVEARMDGASLKGRASGRAVRAKKGAAA